MIEYNSSYDVLVDGKACSSTEQREAILKEYKVSSKCVQFDSMKTMKQADLRSIFTGQDVVYIYHNQIDARGDKAASENEVFTACEEAIEEIYTLIKRIASQANTYHFIVTADHGFIYKRDKIQATDKIAGAASKSNSVGQRYSISAEEIKQTEFAIQRLVRYLAMMMSVLYHSRLLQIFSRWQEQDRTMFMVAVLRRKCLCQ